MKHKKMLAWTLSALGALSLSEPTFARDGDVSLRGAIQAIDATSVTVNGKSCTISASTKFEGSNDTLLTLADFKVGDSVHLQCRDGIARELEQEQESSNPQPSASPSPSASASPSATPSPKHRDDDRDDDSNQRDDNRGKGRSDGKSSPDDTGTREVKARLSAAPNVSTQARGRVEYKSEGNSRKLERRFRAWVSLPLPSSIPAAADINASAALSLGLTLSRAGTAYAHCQLAFDAPEAQENDDSPAARAQYRLDVRVRGNKLPSSRGSCDLDLTTEGVQSGVPSIQKGDSVAIDETNAGVFLVGSL